MAKDEPKNSKTRLKPRSSRRAFKRMGRASRSNFEDQRNTVIVTRTDDPRFWPDGCATVGEARPMTATNDKRQRRWRRAEDEPKVTTKAPEARQEKHVTKKPARRQIPHADLRRQFSRAKITAQRAVKST